MSCLLVIDFSSLNIEHYTKLFSPHDGEMEGAPQ